MDPKLEDKHVLITGASGGIGVSPSGRSVGTGSVNVGVMVGVSVGVSVATSVPSPVSVGVGV